MVSFYLCFFGGNELLPIVHLKVWLNFRIAITFIQKTEAESKL
jgi:hypothetical protein